MVLFKQQSLKTYKSDIPTPALFYNSHGTYTYLTYVFIVSSLFPPSPSALSVLINF